MAKDSAMIVTEIRNKNGNGNGKLTLEGLTSYRRSLVFSAVADPSRCFELQDFLAVELGQKISCKEFDALVLEAQHHRELDPATHPVDERRMAILRKPR